MRDVKNHTFYNANNKLIKIFLPRLSTIDGMKFRRIFPN